MAAENAAPPRRSASAARRFNEAAAHGRGKLRPFIPSHASERAASMRPRRMAAENVTDAWDGTRARPLQ